MIASDSEFDRSRLARGVRLPVTEEREITFASPEDVIVKKLEFFREGGSEKHLRDIVGMMRIQGEGIDRDYMDRWIRGLGLEKEWRLIEERMNG